MREIDNGIIAEGVENEISAGLAQADYTAPEQIENDHPILDLLGDEKSITRGNEKEHKEVYCVAQKCSCGSVWCPTCFVKRKAGNLVARLKELIWKTTRQIILTIDPKNFINGEEAYEYMTGKKLVSNFMRNLVRYEGLTVVDWIWCLEWHRNGFPHLHLFCDVGVEGKAGMIGGETIRKYWKIGAVKESPIRNEKHWDELTGYFKKNGYFDRNKGHQAILPDWAMKRKSNIRRYDSKRKKRERTPEEEERLKRVRNRARARAELKRARKEFGIEEDDNKRRMYEVILKECGSQTKLTVALGSIRMFYQIVNCPYKTLVKGYDHGEYCEGHGYVFKISEGELERFLASYLF